MTFRGSRSVRAFTLVELLVGATLSAAVMAAVFSSYLYLGRSLGRLANQQILETEARRTLGRFTQDVEQATDVTVTPVTAPDFHVTFTLPRDSAGVTQAIYCYSRDGTTTAIGGDNITLPAHTLVRVASTGSTLVGEPQVILRNIVADDEGCFMRFYDSGAKPFDNDTAPYTPVTDYFEGVKQVSLSFRTQLGNAANGTQTRVHQTTSSRVILRNRGFLP